MRKSLNIVNQVCLCVCHPRSTSKIQLNCHLTASLKFTFQVLRTFHYGASSAVSSRQYLRRVANLTSDVVSSEGKGKSLWLRLTPSVTSCDDSVSSSLLRIAHASSSGLSFLLRSPSQQLSRSPLHTTIVLRVIHTRPDRP